MKNMNQFLWPFLAENHSPRDVQNSDHAASAIMASKMIGSNCGCSPILLPFNS